jgi:hypothetical protein
MSSSLRGSIFIDPSLISTLPWNRFLILSGSRLLRGDAERTLVDFRSAALRLPASGAARRLKPQRGEVISDLNGLFIEKG